MWGGVVRFFIRGYFRFSIVEAVVFCFVVVGRRFVSSVRSLACVGLLVLLVCGGSVVGFAGESEGGGYLLVYSGYLFFRSSSCGEGWVEYGVFLFL